MAKSDTHFQFKQFSIQHDKSTMKVGTDGVLLGAWVQASGAKTILDIGTGSGVIALMLAQQSDADARIDAVEIEWQDVHQANENILQSPWPHKVQVHHMAIQNFHPAITYDLIVSNPPYFNNSQEPPDKKRHQTRHTVTLNYQDLLVAINKLLSDTGKFCIILPYQEGLQFQELAKVHAFYCIRQWSFRTRKNKPIERWLLTFSKIEATTECGEICLYEEGDQWSTAYKALTKDFYLKL